MLKLILIAILLLIINLGLSIFIFVKYKSIDNFQDQKAEKDEEDSIYISGSMLTGGPILQD